MTHTVVVLSGGIDSATVLALYAAAGHQLTTVSINYRQRHTRELHYARQLASHYQARHLQRDLPGLGQLLAGSALTDPNVPVPEGHYDTDNMSATVVPNRNMILTSLAVGAAAAAGADQVALGVHAGDHPIYPDCRPEFVTLLNQASQVATDGHGNIAVVAPFVTWGKTQIVALGARLGVPFELTWSCYQGGERHCGRCGTCVERRGAFLAAGLVDPTDYQQVGG